MALTAVNHVLLDAADNPRTGIVVTAELVAPYGYLTGTNEEVIDPVTAMSGPTGLVTLMLVPTTEYVYASAVYKITWDGLAVPKFITVPAAGPVNLTDRLTVAPVPGPVTVPVGGGSGRGIASTTYVSGVLTFHYTDGTSSAGFAIGAGAAGAPGADFGYADATAATYAGGAITGPAPTSDPALSINAAIANSLGRPAIVKSGTYYLQSQLFFTASGQELHLMEGATLVRDFTSASGWGSAMITHDPLANTVKLNDLQISGPGRLITPTGKSGSMVALYGDRQRHSDYTIDGYEDGIAWLLAGDSIRMHNVTLLTPRTHFNPNTGLVDYLTSGGIRFAAGKDFVCSDSHIVSGDDSLQAVPLQGSFTHPFKNQDIDGATYIGCTGRSMEARFMVAVISDKTVAAPSMTCSVKDVKFIGCRGFGGGRGIAVRNETPSSGVIDGVTFSDCTLDQSLATLAAAQQDILVQREDLTGAVRNITFDGVTVRSPKGITLEGQGSVTYPVENLQVRRGLYPANAAATVTIDLGGCVDPVLDGVTTDGGGTGNVILIGGGVKTTTNARVRDHRFLNVPGISNYSALNLNAAPGAQVSSSRFAGGLANTIVRAVRLGAGSLNVLIHNNNLTGLLSTSYWVTLADTRLQDNLGDPGDVGLMPLQEIVTTVTAAGTAQTLPLPAVSTVAHLTLSAVSCAITVWPAAPGQSSSLTLRQHATLTSRLATWIAPAGTTIKWGTSDGLAPVLSTAVNKEDHFSLYSDRAGIIVIVPGPFGL